MKNWQEDNDRYADRTDAGPRRSKRTKFRSLEDESYAEIGRSKQSGKRSRRQKTLKDGYWAEHDL